MLYSKNLGFHFIEILSTLLIVGILTTFSLSTYQHHLAEAERLEAQLLLNKLALALEKYHIEHQTYEGASLENLNFTPSATKHYRVQINRVTLSYYHLTAAHQLESRLNLEVSSDQSK